MEDQEWSHHNTGTGNSGIFAGGMADVDWWNSANIIAIVCALLGLLAPAVGGVYQLRTRRGKRIGHRVQMDTTLGSGDNGKQPAKTKRGIFAVQPGISRPTLVLLRIENNGTESIAETDYLNPDEHHGLTVVFHGRTVENFEVIPDPKATYLLKNFAPLNGQERIRHSGNMIHLPRVPLNKRRHFKLLVLLSGGNVGDEVDVTGDIRDGEVKRTSSRTVDDKPPLFSGLAIGAVIAVLTLSVFTLAGTIVFRNPAHPIGCATGQLRVVGSTAFAPAVQELARRYEKDCPGSDITVAAHGSNEGVREAAETDPAKRPALLALSDGPKPEGYKQLKENRVAIVAFALVLNDKVTLTNLTIDNIRAVYRGDVINWKQLGGPDLPVRLVSRDANSGTRDLLRRRILGGQGEPPFTSRDCVNKDSPQDKITRCELGSTGEVLSTVAQVPGAIGYSELQAATTAKGLHTVDIDGQAPSIKTIGADTYRFTEIEYAYTNGAPAADSLTASFLNYFVRGGGQDTLTSFGHLPCFTPEGLKRCQPS